MIGLSGPLAVLGAPLHPDRDQARGWAIEELSHREYREAQPGFIERAIRWVLEHLDVPGGPAAGLGTGIALVLLVAVIAFAVHRVGGLRRQRRVRGPEGVLGDAPRSAEDYRAAAEQAGRDGDLHTSVLMRFRAIVRDLEERAILAPQPGRTADEAARAAAGWLPQFTEQLAAAARAFDDVRYGDRRPTAATHEQLRELDEQIRRSRPASQPVLTGAPVVPV
jgi:hypothetical protein